MNEFNFVKNDVVYKLPRIKARKTMIIATLKKKTPSSPDRGGASYLCARLRLRLVSDEISEFFFRVARTTE